MKRVKSFVGKMSSVSSDSEYLSCDEVSSISTLDRAEVGRIENSRLYGPRASVGNQTEVLGESAPGNVSAVSSDSGTVSDESVDSWDGRDDNVLEDESFVLGTSQLQYAQENIVMTDGWNRLNYMDEIQQEEERADRLEWPCMAYCDAVEVLGPDRCEASVVPLWRRPRQVRTINLVPGQASPYGSNGRLTSWPVNKEGPWWVGNPSSPFRKLRQIPSLSLLAE